jgi:hypothetical protein
MSFGNALRTTRVPPVISVADLRPASSSDFPFKSFRHSFVMGHSWFAAYKPTQITGSESIFTRLRHFFSSVNGAEGISDIEGKGATGQRRASGEASEFQIRGLKNR